MHRPGIIGGRPASGGGGGSNVKTSSGSLVKTSSGNQVTVG